jgi:hypothetical protein
VLLTVGQATDPRSNPSERGFTSTGIYSPKKTLTSKARVRGFSKRGVSFLIMKTVGVVLPPPG